jgi:hypothetical protein
VNIAFASVDRFFRPFGADEFSSDSHGLRPFDKLKAGCGLNSFAASRLGFSQASLAPAARFEDLADLHGESV